MSSEVLTIEIADTSLSELSNLVNEIKGSFNDLLEPLKEIKDILAEAFKPDPLKDFIGTMADVGSAIIGLVGLAAALVAVGLTAGTAALIAGIVALVVLGVTAIIENWEGICEFFAGVWAGISEGFFFCWDAIVVPQAFDASSLIKSLDYKKIYTTGHSGGGYLSNKSAVNDKRVTSAAYNPLGFSDFDILRNSQLLRLDFNGRSGDHPWRILKIDGLGLAGKCFETAIYPTEQASEVSVCKHGAIISLCYLNYYTLYIIIL